MAFDARVVDERAMTPVTAMPNSDTRLPCMVSLIGAVTITATTKKSAKKVSIIWRLKVPSPANSTDLRAVRRLRNPRRLTPMTITTVIGNRSRTISVSFSIFVLRCQRS